MNKILLRKRFFVIVLMGLMVSHVSFAMSSTSKANKGELSESQRYFWYDGDEKRAVWVNPKLMAEFKIQPETSAQSRSLDTTKKINPQPLFVRFLKTEDASRNAVGRSLSTDTNSQFSPVLHDGALISGIKRALPGNVLIQMKPDWSQEEIEVWLEEHNLTVIKPLTFAPNAFLIKTKLGLDSLNTANRIFETGDVVLASPNWWQERVAR